MLSGFLPTLLDGTLTTLALAGVSLLIAVALGLLGAAAKLARLRALRMVATVYTTIVRGVPDLVLMLLVSIGARSL
jgi:His/Glu/Gln/Arg/opine family amino acid ABC transporter permease subunit